MTRLLQLNTSIFIDDGQSSRLADSFVQTWASRHPETEVFRRDLAVEPVPHLTAERFQALITPPAERSPKQQTVAAYSDMLIDELRQADVIVLGLPMYNFGVPSMLKAYIDHIARAGVTFRYTEQGSEGLLHDKKVYVLAARGGEYQGTLKDTQSRYVTDFFAFIGIDDVEFIYAEGLNMGEAVKAAALATARQCIETLAA